MRVALLIVVGLILTFASGCCRAVKTTVISVASDFPVVAGFKAHEMLLADAAEFLTQISGWKVEIAPEVKSINDLSFDLRDHSGQRLDAILNSIVAYLNGRMLLNLDWKRIEGERRVVIFPAPK